MPGSLSSGEMHHSCTKIYPFSNRPRMALMRDRWWCSATVLADASFVRPELTVLLDLELMVDNTRRMFEYL